MKYIYILKKGLQCYPPCLAQVLYLNDLGIDIVVHHGKNSDYINDILDKRGIEHYTFKSDKESTSNFSSYINFISYTSEVKKLLSKIDNDEVIWFGNCESAITIGKQIKKHRFILTVLELYENGSLYDKLVKKIVPYAEQVICCEKHRAVIMKDRYKLNKIPHIIPNKPYQIDSFNFNENDLYSRTGIDKYKDKKIVLYQGLVQADRPIDNVALALKNLNDDDFVLAVMGKSNHDTEKQIKEIYHNTIFLGYVPAPEHLEITKLSYIGIAIYDDSNLNNQFCAPNKIYEYSAFGTPMITSKNLGLTETVGAFNAGMCVDFKNVNEIERSIEKISGNYKYYSENAQLFYDDVDIKEKIRSVLNP